jgi:hypothetical protein
VPTPRTAIAAVFTRFMNPSLLARRVPLVKLPLADL